MIHTWPFPWKFDRGRYSDLYLLSRVAEDQVQADILELLRSYAADACPLDAGGRRQRGRMMAAARAAGIELAGIQNVKVGRAIPTGFADLEATLAPAGRSLYIECKAPAWLDGNCKLLRAAGRPSEEQLDFLLSKHARGALVMVAWAATDVETYIGPDLRLNRAALVKLEAKRTADHPSCRRLQARPHQAEAGRAHVRCGSGEPGKSTSLKSCQEGNARARARAQFTVFGPRVASPCAISEADS